MGRYAALALPFFALAACGDNDDGGGDSAMTSVPPARDHGEVVVSFTIQAAATSGLSARSFEISVGAGNSAMLLTEADIAVQTPSGTAIAANSTLSAGDVIVVSFTSPSGSLTADDLDYEVGLSGPNHGGLQIDSEAATNTEASSFLASAGEALAREAYKTTGPVLQDASRNPNDDAIFTLTFSEGLHAGSVQADDFTVTDSNGAFRDVQAARLVDGKADEVQLTLVRDLLTNGDVAIEAGALQSTDNVGNEAFPTRIRPYDEATLGRMVGAATNVAVPYATAEQKIITPDTATDSNFLFAAFPIEGGVVQIGTGGQGTTRAEIAQSIFELQIDPGETRNPEHFVDSTNFEIHDAVFTLGGTEVAAGTGDHQLLGSGTQRGNFDELILTIDSRTRRGSAADPVDLYIAAAENAFAETDGTSIDSDDITVTFLGADLVAGVASARAPAARGHGEVVVSFTIQDEATSGLSARSFQINVGAGTRANSAMLLTEADVTVRTPSGVALTPGTSLSKDEVIVVTFTSPSGQLTADDLDYEVELSGTNHGSLQIAGAAATNAEASSFLASAGAALAREAYKTTGPLFEKGTISNDDFTLTITFSEELHAGSVQADDFTVTDSNGASVGIQDVELVDGKAEEVRLTLTRALSTNSSDVAIEAGALQSIDNIGNPAIPERITPIAAAELGNTILGETNVAVPYATPEQKIITPDTASEPNFLIAVLFVGEGVSVQIGTGGQGTSSAEIARSIFELQTDPRETRDPEHFVDSANFEIHEAFFLLDEEIVAAGTGNLELLGPSSNSAGPGNQRGDFDAILLMIDSRARSGSADAPVDLYLVAAENAFALPDGTPIDSNDLTVDFLGPDLVAGV